MVHLNYNHLHYFWVVATFGSIARAAESLHVTPQTISGQLRTLEARVGAPLFQRSGRKLGLTDTGRMVHSYVDPMFNLGSELGDVLQKRAPRRPQPLSAAVATGVARSIAWRVLRSALDPALNAPAVVREEPNEGLLSALLSREIDLAVTEACLPAAHSARLQWHLVGQSGVTFLCTASCAERYRHRFPASLEGAPLVMPGRSSALAKSLAHWFRRQRIAPSVVAEIDSHDLASAVCETEMALCVVPTVAARDTERRYRVAAIGEALGVEQRFYVACAEPPVRLREVLAVVDNARRDFIGVMSTGSSSVPQGLLDSSLASLPALQECALWR